MKYAKDSLIIKGAKDFYSIVSYNVDKIRKTAFVNISFSQVLENGTSEVSYNEYHVTDKVEYIIDPLWDSSSVPSKPDGFDPLNPVSWGDLSWDDIPRVVNPDKLYVTLLIKESELAGSIEKAIFNKLILLGILPNSNEWSFI